MLEMTTISHARGRGALMPLVTLILFAYLSADSAPSYATSASLSTLAEGQPQPTSKNLRRRRAPITSRSGPKLALVRWRLASKGVLQLNVRATSSSPKGLRQIIVQAGARQVRFNARGKKRAAWTTSIRLPRKKKTLDLKVSVIDSHGRRASTKPLAITISKLRSRWRVLARAKLPNKPAAPASSQDIEAQQRVVPDVSGFTRTMAEARLRQADLKASIAQQAVTDQTRLGRVIRQSPPAGSKVQAQSLVTIFIGTAIAN